MTRRYTIKDRKRFYIFMAIILIIAITATTICIKHYSNINIKNEIITENTITENEVETIDASAIQMPQYNIDLSEDLQDYTYNVCMYYGISYELELALLYTESRFDGQAVSSNKVCRGMGQLNRHTGQSIADNLQIENFDIFNEEHNICCSAYYIKMMYDYWSNKGINEEEVTYYVLGSYNRGITGYREYVNTYNRIETEYANIIIDRKMQLEQYGEIVK